MGLIVVILNDAATAILFLLLLLFFSIEAEIGVGGVCGRCCDSLECVARVTG